MKYSGIVTSGSGEASYWVKKIENACMKKINTKLFYGTLNIKLNQDFKIEKADFIIKKEEFMRNPIETFGIILMAKQESIS